MKIESRVEALENELKILKNEIQSTLLEIREQVLNHYYPELRAEEPPTVRSLAAKPNDVRANKSSQDKSNGHYRTAHAGDSTSAPETKVQIQPFSDIFLQDIGNDDFEDNGFEDDELVNIGNLYPEDDSINGTGDTLEDDQDNDDQAISAPKTREVSFNQLKRAPAAPKAKMRGHQEASAPQGQKSSRPAFAALAAWVGESVAKVGKERTIQVAEAYASSGGSLSKETKSAILQLASLASDEEPATPAGNQEMLGLMVELDQVLGAR